MASACHGVGRPGVWSRHGAPRHRVAGRHCECVLHGHPRGRGAPGGSRWPGRPEVGQRRFPEAPQRLVSGWRLPVELAPRARPKAPGARAEARAALRARTSPVLDERMRDRTPRGRGRTRCRRPGPLAVPTGNLERTRVRTRVIPLETDEARALFRPQRGQDPPQAQSARGGEMAGRHRRARPDAHARASTRRGPGS